MFLVIAPNAPHLGTRYEFLDIPLPLPARNMVVLESILHLARSEVLKFLVTPLSTYLSGTQMCSATPASLWTTCSLVEA